MGNTCRNCNAQICWDPVERERIGYRGPLNPSDKSPHKYYDEKIPDIEAVTDKPPPRSPMTAADPTLVSAFPQLVDSIRLLTLSNLASTTEEKEDIRKKVIAPWVL